MILPHEKASKWRDTAGTEIKAPKHPDILYLLDSVDLRDLKGT